MKRLLADKLALLVPRQIQHSRQVAWASPRGRCFHTNCCSIVRLLPRRAAGMGYELSENSRRFGWLVDSATGRRCRKDREAAVIPDIARRCVWRGHRPEGWIKPQECLRHSIRPSFRPQGQVERRKFIVHVIVTSCQDARGASDWSEGRRALVTNAKTSGRHSSGVNLKLRRAAAVARSSRRVRNSMPPSTMRKSSRWMRPQSQHCSRKLRMRGRVHSPYEMTW
jgi:hypothetical protein